MNNNSSLALKQSAIICLCNCAAFFDFLIYLYLDDIIGFTFFPTDGDVTLAKLQALSVFVAGYFARPIGAYIVGRYGDSRGRKPAMIATLSVLAVATFITALLPTYAEFGLLASVLFVSVRMIIGMAFGAQSALGWVHLSEHALRDNIAFIGNISTASFMLAITLSIIFFEVLYNSYSDAELIEYAWSIPFIVGAVLSFIALASCFFMKETPIFQSLINRKSFLPNPRNFKLSLNTLHMIFLSFLLSFYTASYVFVISLLLPSLLSLKFSIETGMLTFANGLGILFIGIGTLFYGLLADKGHIGKTLMIGSVAVSLQSMLFFYYLQHGAGDYILIMYALLGFCAGVAGLAPIVIVQLFPTKTRLTAVSVIYNSAYALVGAVLPFFLEYTMNTVSFSPALYLMFVSIIGFMVGVYLYSTPKLKALDVQQ